MNIIVCGPKDGRTFNYLTATFNQMGHTCYHVDSNTEYKMLPFYSNGNKPDFVIIPRVGHILEEVMSIKSKGAKVYMYNTDVRGSMISYQREFGDTIKDTMLVCDMVYTPMDFEVEMFKANGIKSKQLMQGCFPEVDQCERAEEFKHDVLFVGSIGAFHEKTCGRTSVLRAINKAVGVYVTEAWGKEGAELYACSKITIGSDAYGDLGTGPSVRMFQVLAAGGFLLTNHMFGMDKFFEVGKEFAVYEGPDDAVDKVKHYMANETERENIANYGQKKCLELYTYRNRMQEIINDHMCSLSH
jgi:spore maturation protein CgeB